MSSFAYDSSHSSLFECFASNNNENEETILKDLVETVEDLKNQTSMKRDTLLINLERLKNPEKLKSKNPKPPRSKKSLFHS